MEQKSPRRSMSDIRPARPMDTIVRPAAGSRPAPQPVAPTPQPVVAPQPAAPVYTPEPEPVASVAPAKPRKKRTGLVVTLVILIPLIAAAVAYYLFIFKATAY